MTTAAEFIAGFEGFAERAYWDVNAFRLGYGSDTEGPDQVHVTAGMETTKERALQNLNARIPQFAHDAIYGHGGMGVDVWRKLYENQRTALLSLVYNYGRLPVVVTPDDPEKTADAIRALQGANGGINRKRRLAEAEFYLTADATLPAGQKTTSRPLPSIPAPQVPATPQVPPAPPAAPPIPASWAARLAVELDQLISLQTAYRAELPTPFDEAITALQKLGTATTSVLQLPAADPAAITPQGILHMPPNIWTSIFGTGGILAAGVAVFTSVKNGETPDATQVAVLLGMISTGIGLIKAKDANVTGGTVPATEEAKTRAVSRPIK